MSDHRRPPAAQTTVEPDVLRQIRRADSLSALAESLRAPSLPAAYVRAKAHWAQASEEKRRADPRPEGLPGDRIDVGDTTVTVHGLTHADTDAERSFVRDHVRDFERAGSAIYCEEGIRELYLRDVPAAYAMDDYRWAMAQAVDRSRKTPGFSRYTSELTGLVASLTDRARSFREETYALIESGCDLYGEEFAAALGDVASSFLTGREDLATGDDFEAFRRTRRAARDPAALPALQRYYWRTLLPQPLERDWLRRHDPELELLTHARNERMADYVLHHAEASPVHVLVGAAHQPGVIDYLRRYRDGHREPVDFEYVA